MDGISSGTGLAGPTGERSAIVGSAATGLTVGGGKLGLGRHVGDGPVITESEEPNMESEHNMATFKTGSNPPGDLTVDGACDSERDDRMGTTVPKVIDGEATVH